MIYVYCASEKAKKQAFEDFVLHEWKCNHFKGQVEGPDEEVICFGDEEIYAKEKDEPEYVVITEGQFKAWNERNVSPITGNERETPNLLVGNC